MLHVYERHPVQNFLVGCHLLCVIDYRVTIPFVAHCPSSISRRWYLACCSSFEVDGCETQKTQGASMCGFQLSNIIRGKERRGVILVSTWSQRGMYWLRYSGNCAIPRRSTAMGTMDCDALLPHFPVRRAWRHCCNADTESQLHGMRLSGCLI